MKKIFSTLFFLFLSATFLFAGSNAQFISQQNVPAAAKTGASYWVDITMKNNGTTTWTSGGTNPFLLGSTNPDNNLNWGTGRVALPSSSIAPGQNAVFHFKILAPDSAGIYNFQWHMLQEGIEWFGDYTTNMQINVTQSNNAFDKTQIDASRFGIYYFAGFASLNNPGPSFLETCSDLAENMGTQVIRVFMSPSTDNSYHLNGGGCIQNFTLKSLAQRADFQQIFSNPQFKTIMFTAYDGVTHPNCVSKFLLPSFYTPTTIAQIENEYKELAQYLGATYPDKTFIVAHWEGDNAVYNSTCIAADSCKARIGAYTKWINARTAGIHAANVNNVFSCMEFNYRAGFDPGPLNLMHDALPNINADYFSYSCWASSWTVATNEADQYKSEIHSIRNIMAGAGQDSTKLIIGEFGYNHDNRLLSRDKHVVLAQAINDLNIPYALIWHLLDVDGSLVSPFGLYDPNAVITPTGQAYCDLWSGSACGNISDAGITALVSPTNSSCPDTISPVVTLKNFSNYELDAIRIDYRVDNGAIVSSQFAVPYGNGMAAGNSMNLTLNSSVFSAGAHQVKVFSSLPNGKNDAVNTNDTLVVTLNINCTTGIEENIASLSLNVFPVPAKDILTVEYSLLQASDLKLYLVNTLGQKVYSENTGTKLPGTFTKQVDVSGLNAGVYHLILFSGEGKIMAAKPVVLR